MRLPYHNDDDDEACRSAVQLADHSVAAVVAAAVVVVFFVDVSVAAAAAVTGFVPHAKTSILTRYGATANNTVEAFNHVMAERRSHIECVALDAIVVVPVPRSS